MAGAGGRWPAGRSRMRPPETLGGSCEWCWWTMSLAKGSWGRSLTPEARRSAWIQRKRADESNLTPAGATSSRGARNTALELKAAKISELADDQEIKTGSR